MNFIVDKNVPIAVFGNEKAMSECPYPFSSMSVGDSFHVSGDFSYLSKNRGSIAHWVKKFRKNVDKNFSIATRTEAGGFRVWRVN